MINRESDMTVCGEAEDRGDALEVITREKPRLAIIDLSGIPPNFYAAPLLGKASTLEVSKIAGPFPR